jgi:competence protein ComEC
MSNNFIRISIYFAILILYLFFPFTNYGDTLYIHTLNVGQGDSTLIITPDNIKILIDGGPDSEVISQIDQVLPFWDRRIDALFLSHPDTDHISGLIDVLQRYDVAAIYTTPATKDSPSFAAYQREVERQRPKIINFTRGVEVKSDDGVVLTGVWPLSETRWSRVGNANQVSQVMMLNYRHFTAAFTGDIDTEVADKLAELKSLTDIDYLKAPHHGSKYGFTQSQLQLMTPLISTISVGGKNRYGHPSSSTVEVLSKESERVLRTDVEGRITVAVDNSGISVSSE